MTMTTSTLMAVIRRRTATATPAVMAMAMDKVNQQRLQRHPYNRHNQRTFCDAKSLSDVPLEAIKAKVANLGGGEVHLQLDEERGLVRLTLSNVSKRNALSGRMMCQLHDQMERLTHLVNDNKVKCVLISSQDNDSDSDKKVVCSGGDLDVVREIMNPQAGREQC